MSNMKNNLVFVILLYLCSCNEVNKKIELKTETLIYRVSSRKHKVNGRVNIRYEDYMCNDTLMTKASYFGRDSIVFKEVVWASLEDYYKLIRSSVYNNKDTVNKDLLNPLTLPKGIQIDYLNKFFLTNLNNGTLNQFVHYKAKKIIEDEKGMEYTFWIKRDDILDESEIIFTDTETISLMKNENYRLLHTFEIQEGVDTLVLQIMK